MSSPVAAKMLELRLELVLIDIGWGGGVGRWGRSSDTRPGYRHRGNISIIIPNTETCVPVCVVSYCLHEVQQAQA